MPRLNIAQIFGTNAIFVDAGTTGDFARLEMNLGDFHDAANGGNIQNGIGFDDTGLLTTATANDAAESIFYALMLLIQQNQAANINDDPSSKIYITDGGKRFATGARDGQIQRVFSVNLFVDANLNSLPDMDDVAGFAPQV